jgi:hypothetical protein
MGLAKADGPPPAVAGLGWLMLSSTVMHAHSRPAAGKRSEGNQCLGRSRESRPRKPRRLAASLGNPLRVVLTVGHASDGREAIFLLATVPIITVEVVLADHA